jgi:hypothetical protein
MEEAEKLEKELQRYYDVYMEKHRNLDYLEHELDKYRRNEEERMEVSCCSFVVISADKVTQVCRNCVVIVAPRFLINSNFRVARVVVACIPFTSSPLCICIVLCAGARAPAAQDARAAAQGGGGPHARRSARARRRRGGPLQRRQEGLQRARWVRVDCSPTSSCSLTRKNLSLTGGSCVIS